MTRPYDCFRFQLYPRDGRIIKEVYSTNLMTKRGILAIGLISALLLGGLGATVVATSPYTQTADAAPIVTVSEMQTGTLTVLVGAKIEGRLVPMAAVELEVFSVNITKEAGVVTIVLEKVAEGSTNASGGAEFALEHGKYLIVAHFNGLKAFSLVNLDEDETVKMLLHNWERHFPPGADRINRITITVEYETTD